MTELRAVTLGCHVEAFLGQGAERSHSSITTPAALTSYIRASLKSLHRKLHYLSVPNKLIIKQRIGTFKGFHIKPHIPCKEKEIRKKKDEMTL